jgi:hypothetical protein
MLITNKKNNPMRKLLLGAAMLLMAQISFGQAVTDNAVIPVSITLNSILRLSVTSGGNIQFVVNTIDQYENGIPNASQYTTTFQVASSRNFEVTLGAEDQTFVGLETGSTSLALDNVGYTMGGTGTGTVPGSLQALVALVDGLGASTATTIVDGDAGAAADNIYEIQWELGTMETGMNPTSLLEQSLDADIYITNVFLNVVPVP